VSVCLLVCLFVCRSVRISKKTAIRGVIPNPTIRQNFLIGFVKIPPINGHGLGSGPVLLASYAADLYTLCEIVNSHTAQLLLQLLCYVEKVV